MNKKQIVIVGAGFAGLEAALTLASKSSPNDYQITIIDEKNHHLFQPLLYQVATAGLNPADIAFPIRAVFAGFPHVEVLMGKVVDLDLTAQQVFYEKEGNGEKFKLAYDELILACGATHSYFGREHDWEEEAPGLKTLEQAIEIRRRVLMAFEAAEHFDRPQLQEDYLTFVVVGGGPTGVELAGALAEIAYFTMAKDFVRIDPKKTKILLLEAGDRLLPSFDPKLSEKAQKALEKLGVIVKTKTLVTEIRKGEVTTSHETIKTKTVLWAAGVKPSPLNELLKTELDSKGRVNITDHLTLKEHDNVYVVGDQANYQDLPGLASVAKQQGHLAALNILGQQKTPFKYFDKGQMATIGRHQAVMQFAGTKWHGFFAWAAWLLVHIYYLIGFRNRFSVFFTWAWSYLTYNKGARLITQKEWRSFR